MARLGLFAAQLLAVVVAFAATKAAAANILIQIDKPSQTMTVAVDGQVRYRWRVSTGLFNPQPAPTLPSAWR